MKPKTKRITFMGIVLLMLVVALGIRFKENATILNSSNIPAKMPFGECKVQTIVENALQNYGLGYTYNMLQSGEISTSRIGERAVNKNFIKQYADFMFTYSDSFEIDATEKSDQKNVNKLIQSATGIIPRIRKSTLKLYQVTDDTAVGLAIGQVREGRYLFSNNPNILKESLTFQFQYDLNTMEPKQFFKDYGTHILNDIGIGGVFMNSFSVANKSNEYSFGIPKFKIAIKKKLWKFENPSTETGYDQEEKHIMENSAEIYSFLGGGIGGLGKFIPADKNDNKKMPLETYYNSWKNSLNLCNPNSVTLIGGPSINSKITDFSIPVWDFADSSVRRN